MQYFDVEICKFEYAPDIVSYQQANNEQYRYYHDPMQQ